MSTLPELIASDTDWLILDTETTGLDQFAEIVSIAVVDRYGQILIDELVKPTRPIPSEATAIHGIHDDMVAKALTWDQLACDVLDTIRGRDVVVYNAAYDVRMMIQSSGARGVPHDWCEDARWHCAMEEYAVFWGDWNDYHQSYTWQSLTRACQQQGVELLKAHGAIDDALMTLALCKKVWGNNA
jgi:DNA polymerase-3 subunit epsilon